MSSFAYVLLAVSFLCTISAGAGALVQIKGQIKGQIRGETRGQTAFSTRWLERTHLALTLLLSASAAVLFLAFANNLFSFSYVADHSDRALPFFYRLTAFWAGQEGALLFWVWAIALAAALFASGAGYRGLSPLTRLWYWVLLYAVLAFFLLLLTAWSNPFLALSPIPQDGDGMNPMLQNPGMVFHPPLLFLGYAGFTLPACLGIAQLLSGATRHNSAGMEAEPLWSMASRGYILVSWLFLSAGIILGAWWSYMELGWGGYWAWDPVENTSLVPWLIATAYLHTAIVERQRGKLGRVNAFLMALVLVSAFFATYIVRGNVVASLHAFGSSAVGTPLQLLVLVSLALVLVVCVGAPRQGEALGSPLSKEGLLTCSAWVFLALAFIVTLGTMWPVLSRLWSDNTIGLEASFFNHSCLPLFALLALLLGICPWVRWDGRLTDRGSAAVAGGICLLAAGMLAYLGLRPLTALVAAAAAIGGIGSICLLFVCTPKLLGSPRSVAAHGVHLGLALMVLGVAFSGPGKTEQDLTLTPGQSFVMGEYTLTLQTVESGDAHSKKPEAEKSAAAGQKAAPAYIYAEARIEVLRNGVYSGMLSPQLRLYAKSAERPFSEVSTLFSMGAELYATLLAVDQTGVITIKVSRNPLVNWIWLGGILLCLFPFVALLPEKHHGNPENPEKQRAQHGGLTGTGTADGTRKTRHARTVHDGRP